MTSSSSVSSSSSSGKNGVGKLAEIHIPSPGAQDTQLSSVHAMPLHTNFNGPAPIKAFFNTTIRTAGASSPECGKNMTSYVRGRELKGKVFPVPEGMVGTIVRKDTETGCEKKINYTNFFPASCLFLFF